MRATYAVFAALTAIGGSAAAATPYTSHERALVVSTLGHDADDISAYIPESVKGLGVPQPWAGTPLAAAVEERFGPSPSRLSSSVLADLAERARRSQRALFFDQTHITEAIDDLEEVRRQLAEALGTISKKHDARALYYDVLLSLARAYQTNRQVQNAARQADLRMEEVVRYFPDMPLDATHHERELYELFTRTVQRLPAKRTLTIRLSGDENARICINGRCAEKRAIPLCVGQYRFFVTTANHGDGRVHTVIVRDVDITVNVDVPFEVALRTEPVAGFRFSDAIERAAQEPRFVSTLGVAIHVDQVVVLGETLLRDQPVLDLTSYDVKRNILTSIATPGGAGLVPVAQLGRLGQRVAKEQAAAAGKGSRPTPEEDRAARFIVLVAARTAGTPTPSAPSPSAREIVEPPPAVLLAEPRRDTTYPVLLEGSLTRQVYYYSGWAALVSGAVITPIGFYFHFRQGIGTCLSPTQICPQTYGDANVSVLLGLGPSLSGVGLFHVLLGSRGEYMRDGGIATIVDGAVAMATGGVMLYLDQFPINYQYRGGTYVKNTVGFRAESWAAIGVGAAAIAGGSAAVIFDHINRAHRRHRMRLSAAPAVSPNYSGLSIAGSF